MCFFYVFEHFCDLNKANFGFFLHISSKNRNFALSNKICDYCL